VKQRIAILTLTAAGVLLLTTGCKSLFPNKSSVTDSRWHSYEHVEFDFGKIIPYHTDTNELKTLGFCPGASPNIKVLTYVDIIPIFMPNPGIQREDLPKPVQECLAAREHGCAYLIDLHDTQSRRHGNLFLDIFGFKRHTHEMGWSFKGLILLKNGVVVYKLSSGEPQISTEDDVNHPLGPFQEVDGSFLNVITVYK
jgi:hypothetical protein